MVIVLKKTPIIPESMFDSTYIGYYYLLARAFLPLPASMDYEEKLIRLLIVDEGYHRAEQITSSLRATGMQVREIGRAHV